MFSFTRTKSEICQNVNIWSLLEESSWVFVLTILYNFLRLNFFQLQMHAKIRMNTDFGVKDLVALAPSSCAERLPVAYFLRLCFSFLCQKIVLIILPIEDECGMLGLDAWPWSMRNIQWLVVTWNRSAAASQALWAEYGHPGLWEIFYSQLQTISRKRKCIQWHYKEKTSLERTVCITSILVSMCHKINLQYLRNV